MYFDNAGWPNTVWASGVRLRTLKALSKKRPLLGLLICRDMCMHFDFFDFFFMWVCFEALPTSIVHWDFVFLTNVAFSTPSGFFFIQSILFYKIQSMYFVHTLWEILKKKNPCRVKLSSLLQVTGIFFFFFCSTLSLDIIFCSRLLSVGLYLFGNTGQMVDITNAVQDF